MMRLLARPMAFLLFIFTLQLTGNTVAASVVGLSIDWRITGYYFDSGTSDKIVFKALEIADDLYYVNDIVRQEYDFRLAQENRRQNSAGEWIYDEVMVPARRETYILKGYLSSNLIENRFVHERINDYYYDYDTSSNGFQYLNTRYFESSHNIMNVEYFGSTQKYLGYVLPIELNHGDLLSKSDLRITTVPLDGSVLGTYATAVPLPPTLWLMVSACALAAAGFRRRS